MGFWELILLISFVCLGLTTISGDEKILEPIRDWFEFNVPTFIAKPIITCCTCMSSFWGTTIFWLHTFYLFQWNYKELFYALEIVMIMKWIASCVIAAFVNYTIKIHLDYLKKLIES